MRELAKASNSQLKFNFEIYEKLNLKISHYGERQINSKLSKEDLNEQESKFVHFIVLVHVLIY